MSAILSDREQARQLCEMTHHRWEDDYYGYRCANCGDFIPYGSEPWLPVDTDDSDDEWELYY